MLSTRRQRGIDEIAHLHVFTVSNLNYFIAEILLEVLWSPLAQCRPFSHGTQDHNGSIAAHVALKKIPVRQLTRVNGIHGTRRRNPNFRYNPVTAAASAKLIDTMADPFWTLCRYVKEQA